MWKQMLILKYPFLHYKRIISFYISYPEIGHAILKCALWTFEQE